MTTTTRIDLALAACEGLSDLELTERGAGGFKNMITRKRYYSKAARELAAANLAMQEQVAALKAQLATVTANYDALQASVIEPSCVPNEAIQALAQFKLPK